MLDHAWEHDKENIRPLVSGRRAAIIIGSASIEEDSKFFEEKVSLSDDSDLVINWYHYVSWYEQKCLTGGKSFYDLLERCLRSVPFEKTNFENVYYARIWIKYAEINENNLEIYRFMFSCGIGSTLINFYISWSRLLEVSGYMIQALEVMNIAIARNIPGSCHLKMYTRALESRIAELRTANVKFDETGLLSSECDHENARKAFADLIKKCKYEESMDRASYATKAEPYESKDPSLLNLLGSRSVRNTISAENIHEDSSDAQNDDNLHSLIGPWAAPYITSRNSVDNRVPSCQSLGRPTRKFGPKESQNKSSFTEESTSQRVEVYNEEAEGIPEDKSCADASSLLSASTNLPNHNNRFYVFKRSKMPAEVKERLRLTLNDKNAGKNLPVIRWIVSPVVDYSTSDKEYSFEELVAARLKKKLQKKK